MKKRNDKSNLDAYRGPGRSAPSTPNAPLVINPSGLLVQLDGSGAAGASLGFETLLSPPNISNVRGVDECFLGGGVGDAGGVAGVAGNGRVGGALNVPNLATHDAVSPSPARTTTAMSLLLGVWGEAHAGGAEGARELLYSVDLFGGAMRTVLPKSFKVSVGHLMCLCLM